MLAAGDPDPNFGTGTGNNTGEVVVPISPVQLTDTLTSSLIDSQGRLLLAGTSQNPNSTTNTDFAITRLLQDGSIDTGFGTGGTVILPLGLTEDRLTDIALQSTGAIILSGFYSVSGNDLAVDPQFDTVVTSTNRLFSLEDVGMQIRITSPNPWTPGTYEVVSVDPTTGAATLDSSPAPVGTVSGNWFADKYDFAAVRLTTAGVLDTTFGLNGFMFVPIAPASFLNPDPASQTPVPQLDAQGMSVAIDSLNRIVIGGFVEVPNSTGSGTNNDFAVVRLTAAGALDTTFNNGTAAQGKVITPVGTSVDDEANSVAIDAFNNIVLAGFTAGANNSNFAFARYLAGTGALDTSFGTAGTLSIDFGTASNVLRDIANSVIILSDGSIVAAGITGSRLANAPTDIGVLKITSTGTPVAAFGTNGRVTYSASTGDDSGQSIAFQPAGNGNTVSRLVVGGTQENGTNEDFVSIRLDPITGALDTTWGINGEVSTSFGSRVDRGASVSIVPSTAPPQAIPGGTVSNVGKVVLAGTTDVNTSGASNFDFAAVRYLNDGPSLPQVNISSVAQFEGNAGTTQFVFTVTISAAPTAAVSVNFATADGTATAGSDYQATSGVLNFPANSTASRTITVLVNGDTAPEVNETFSVILSGLSPTTAARLGTSTGIGTINNDDAGLSIISSVIQPEGNTSVNNFMVFPVTLTAPPAGTVTVSFSVTPGSATAGADYTPTTGILTLSAAAPIQNISVPIIGDLTGEPDETFTVTLSNATGAAIIPGAGTSTGTIRNDDGAPIFLNIADPSAITEGDSGTRNLVFTVTRSGGGNTVVVDYTTADGTATANADYLPRTGKLTFSSSTTTRTITVPVIGDLLAESTETFQVTLSNATNGGTIQDGDATGTILDTDIDVAELVISDARITESETTQNLVFLVQLTKPLSQPVNVQYFTLNGGAVSGTDFIGVPQGSPQTITLAANTVLQTISIPIIGDGIAESFEEFVVRLQNATTTAPAAVSIRDADGKGSIVDNDLTGSIYINDTTVYEPGVGTANAVFTVSLSRAVNTTVTVNFTTAAGTAASPGDFNASAGVVTFAPGVISRTVTVQVLADGLAEGSENFLVNLSSPSNGRIFDGQGVATIIDSAAGVAPDVVIDDGDGGFSTNGAWTNGSNTQAYQLDFKSIQPGNSNAQATWSAPVAAGTYEVFTRWVPFVNRAAAVTYTILQNNTPLRVAVVSQLVAPNDVVARGVTWESLGTVTLTADGVLRVRVNGNSSGIVTADAVRFVPVTVAPLQMAPLSASLIATSATAAASQTSPATTTPESSAPAAGSLAAYVANQPSTGPAVAAPATFIGPRRLTAAQEAAFSSLLFLEDLQLEWLK